MKNIIITGASHGIGRAIAKSLRKKYHVINIDIVENKMEKVDFYKCDLSDKSQLLKTIEKIKTNIDSLDVLINNAAIFSSKILEKQTFEEWENIINTNLTAPYILSKEFASFLKTLMFSSFPKTFKAISLEEISFFPASVRMSALKIISSCFL